MRRSVPDRTPPHPQFLIQLPRRNLLCVGGVPPGGELGAPSFRGWTDARGMRHSSELSKQDKYHRAKQGKAWQSHEEMYTVWGGTLLHTSPAYGRKRARGRTHSTEHTCRNVKQIVGIKGSAATKCGPNQQQITCSSPRNHANGHEEAPAMAPK